VVSTIAGQAGIAGSVDGTNSSALFSSPGGLATDGSGSLYLTDWVVMTIAGLAGN